jgi:hypothetical protein
VTGSDAPTAAERAAATDTLTGLLHALDALDWAGARVYLADRLRTDYTELFGGEPAEQTGDELIAQWQGLLPGFTATQHLVGPALVQRRADGLRLETHVAGQHVVADVPGGQVWAVYGNYLVTLVPAGSRYVITDLVLQLHFVNGNTDLPLLAAERAASDPRAPRAG